MLLVLASTSVGVTPEQVFMNAFIDEFHDALAPELTMRLQRAGVQQGRLHYAVNSAVIWEAECALVATEHLGEDARATVLERVMAGETTTEARLAAQHARVLTLRSRGLDDAEIEEHLLAYHEGFSRCLDQRLAENGLPPLNLIAERLQETHHND